MRYFHRTSVPLEQVLDEADKLFGARMEQVAATDRSRTYAGTIGKIVIAVEAEGGHYTRITASTDQVGESEADKLAKRFLALVHQRVHPEHEVRGAY